MTNETMVAAITAAYVECAVWSSLDDDGTPLDDADAGYVLADEARATMRADVVAFLDYCDDEQIEWSDAVSWEMFGHDFWLTRNGHGAGFWDRGIGEIGDRLTDAAHSFGSADLYVGDDGAIYHA